MKASYIRYVLAYWDMANSQVLKLLLPFNFSYYSTYKGNLGASSIIKGTSTRGRGGGVGVRVRIGKVSGEGGIDILGVGIWVGIYKIIYLIRWSWLVNTLF